MSRFLTLWRARPWLTTAFVLACVVTLVFAGRFVTFTVYWATHREVPVEPWMTVGYVARSWGLDPMALDRAAGLPLLEELGRPQTLGEIAGNRGVPVDQVIAELEAAIATLRAGAP